MKTVGQLRYEKKLTAPFNKDSVYKPIERKRKKFAPLKVPNKLSAKLPFKSKPKQEVAKSAAQRKAEHGIGIIKSKHEKQVDHLITQLGMFKNIRKQKDRVKRLQRAQKIEKLNKAKVEDLARRDKERRKKRYRDQGQ